MRLSLRALVKSQILYSALKRNKFQKTHILKMEYLSPTISYTCSNVSSVFAWNLPVQLGCYNSCSWISYLNAAVWCKNADRALTIQGDQHDVVLCVCVVGSDHRILSVTRTKDALNLLLPWLVPVDDSAFLSALKPQAGGFVPLIGCKKTSTV